MAPARTAADHDLLATYAAAWNRHDLEAIMSMMTPDCIFETSGGPDPCGRRFVGQQAVRTAIAEIFASLPDIRFTAARHFSAGDRGVSEWTMVDPRGRRPDQSARLRPLRVRERKDSPQGFVPQATPAGLAWTIGRSKHRRHPRRPWRG